MLYVCTVFDVNRDSRPLVSATYDDKSHNLKLYDLYLPKTGRKIYDIEQDIKRIAAVIKDAPEVHLNDYKQHSIAFGLSDEIADNVYDDPFKWDVNPPREETRKAVSQGIRTMKLNGSHQWMRLRARAACVYRYLQERGAVFGYEQARPIWHMDLYSGRTRTTGFNIQGLGEGDPVGNINGDTQFINFDWVSADLRVAALMSGDEKLEESFKHSDPYVYLAEFVNQGAEKDLLTRNEAKGAMIRSLYAMNEGSPALDFYSDLRDWMVGCRINYERDGYLSSILGRKFRPDLKKDKGIRSVFNGTIQGSVVHAMQLCIRKVWDRFPDNVLIESHDSMTITCRPEQAPEIMKYVRNVMMHPFREVIDANPIFPIEISIGKIYKKWKSSKRIYG